MRALNQRRLLVLSQVILLILVGFGLAVPSINVSVQEIGSGSGTLMPSACSGGFYVTNNGIQVDIGNDLPAGTTVYVSLYNSNEKILETSSRTFSSTWPANAPFEVTFSQNALNQADFSKTRVTVLDGYSNSSLGRISLYLQKLSTGNWSGEYAQPINITYTGSKTLKNWPVKVVLSNSNPENPYGSGTYYIEWDVLQNSVSSIHFVDKNGRLLYYWIEIFHPGTSSNNYNDAYAVIWVNVTEISPGGTQIWMIYGKGDYSSYNNGSKVFPFFDDFETWSSWTQYKKGVVQQVNDNFEYGGSHAAEKTSYNDPNGAYKSLGEIFSRNSPYEGLILEYWDNRVDYNSNYRDGPLDRVGLIDGQGNGYGAILNAINDNIQIDVRTKYRGSRHKRISNLGLQMNTWYLVQFEILSNGSITMRVYDENYKLLGSTSYTDSQYFDFTRVYIFGGRTYHIDDLRVRFYSEDEPQTHVDEWYAYLQFMPSCESIPK
jgi:hypothetical protein